MQDYGAEVIALCESILIGAANAAVRYLQRIIKAICLCRKEQQSVCKANRWH